MENLAMLPAVANTSMRMQCVWDNRQLTMPVLFGREIKQEDFLFNSEMVYEGSNFDNAQINYIEENLEYPSINEDGSALVSSDIHTRQRRPCCCGYCSTGIKKYRNGKLIHLCPYDGCSKTFNKVYQMHNHLITHTGEKPYVCSFEYCDKKFRRSDDLLRHVRIHTNERKYVCEYCKKAFLRSDHLSKHMKLHLKAKGRSKP